MDRTRLIEQMQEARAVFEEALSGIERQRMAQPDLSNGWSVKDLLAHIGWWARRVADGYPIMVRGQNPDPELKGMTTDEINARIYSLFRDSPLEEILRYEELAYNDLLGVAQQAPEDDLFNPRRFAVTGGNTFADWIAANSFEHYGDHIEELQALAARSV